MEAELTIYDRPRALGETQLLTQGRKIHIKGRTQYMKAIVKYKQQPSRDVINTGLAGIPVYLTENSNMEF